MINNHPHLSFVYDRRKIATPNKKSSLELRISYNKKQRYISTGITLLPNQWKKGTIVNCPDAMQLTQVLNNLLTNVRQILLDMMNKEGIDISNVPKMLKRMGQDLSFISFCEQRTTIRMFGKQADTKERYKRFLNHFKGWGCIQDFSDISDQNIIAYDSHLKNKGMKPYSKWNNYHRFLNSFISDAIDEGYIKRNPYKWLNIEKEKASKGIERCLTPAEFSRIKTVQLPTKSLNEVRDVFIFQVYTCLSYSDLKDFDSKAIQEIKGMKVYIGSRAKTDKPFTIPILSPAWDILMKYDGELPIISNVKYNLYLKTIAQAAGIDKPVSTHWARHTGATLLLNAGIDMKIVSKICGHSSTKITEQVYAKLLDETVVDAISKLQVNEK